MKLSQKVLRRMAGMAGAIDISIALSEWMGRSPRIDTSWRHVEGWVDDLVKNETSHHENPNSARLRILFFAIYPHWIDYSMAIATLLCGRGISVDFRWLGEMTPLASYPRPARESFWKRQAGMKGNTHLHSRLLLQSLDRAELAPIDDRMKQCAQAQAQIDVSYLLKKERVNVLEDPVDRETFAERYERNLRAIRLVTAAFRKQPFSRLLLGNGGVLEFGAVYRYFQSLDVPVTTFESVDIRNRIWIAHHESVVRADTSGLWKADEPHVVTPERRDRVLEIMKMRQTPDSDKFVIPYQSVSPASARMIRKQMNLDEHRPTVLVCPNVPFDAVFYAGGRQVFSGMWEWLVETCRALALRKDCQVIVRCHPAEPYFDTKETALFLLNEYLPDLPDHIHIVAPGDSISTYSLMEICDLGVVFASTTGLEMAVRGIPVVCGNPSQHYNRKGFTTDPDSREDYFGAIDRILKNSAGSRLTDRQVELAYCYADLYFNQWYRRFPWQAQSLWADMKAWPIGRILSEEGQREFGPVLDELVNGPAALSVRHE